MPSSGTEDTAPPKKRAKQTRKTDEQITVLKKEFDICNQLNNDRISSISSITGLTKLQIQNWFSRRRQKNMENNKENINPDESNN